MTLAGQTVSQLEHERGLARTRRSGKEGSDRWGHALATEGVIDKLDAGLASLLELVRHLDVENVGASIDRCVLSFESHYEPPQVVCVVFVYIITSCPWSYTLPKAG